MQFSNHNWHGSLYLQMETNVNSGVGNPSLKRLVVSEDCPSVWNGMCPSFFPNEVIHIVFISCFFIRYFI